MDPEHEFPQLLIITLFIVRKGGHYGVPSSLPCKFYVPLMVLRCPLIRGFTVYLDYYLRGKLTSGTLYSMPIDCLVLRT